MKRKRDDEGNGTDSQNDAEQDNNRRNAFQKVGGYIRQAIQNLGGYISHASAGSQPSEEEPRAAAEKRAKAAEKRATSQASRGVSGRTPSLSTQAGTTYRGRNTLEFSDAATWN